MSANILVVDDERFIIEAISQHLKDKGYNILSLTDSVKALETVKKQDFDLVLTDLRMPDVSGMDIARAVRALNTDTMVIILTGYATLDTAIESVSLNVYAYLNKPFELRELGEIVERALAVQSLERENKALHVNIAKMLDDVSTLYEVTRFLYDTDDWDISMEFILDTLSIGLGLTHSCLIERHNKDQFVIAKSNFAEGSAFSKKVFGFPWHSLEKHISPTEPTYLQHNNSETHVFDELSSSEESLRGILFTPVRYREHLLGFLVVFVTANMEEPSRDMRMLLQILAIQISPQLYQSQEKTKDASRKAIIWHAEAEKFLQELIHRQTEPDKCIGANFLRFVTPQPLVSLESVELFQEDCEKMVSKHDPDAQIFWLLADTAWVLFPGSNQVQSEITCMALAEEFRKTELTDAKKGRFAGLYYGSSCWPQSSLDAGQIVTGAWVRFTEHVQNSIRERSNEGSQDA
ncbi:response regulator [Candidatus Neomarinimicrobiota bacterium]